MLDDNLANILKHYSKGYFSYPQHSMAAYSKKEKHTIQLLYIQENHTNCSMNKRKKTSQHKEAFMLRKINLAIPNL